MNDLHALEKALNDTILAGKALDALDQFYADDVEMQENLEPACKGKAQNREREIGFFGTIETFHGVSLHASAVAATGPGTGTTFSEWTFEYTFKGGPRVAMTEVARRTWRDGKVVHERFYYHRG